MCVPMLVTTHVETVVLLSQQKPDDTIEIDLDLDELDATSAELKATYQEIKDYVLKEFGLKVSYPPSSEEGILHILFSAGLPRSHLQEM